MALFDSKGSGVTYMFMDKPKQKCLHFGKTKILKLGTGNLKQERVFLWIV